MKTLNEITLYDLMAEDLTISVKKDDSFGFDVEIDNDKFDVIIEEKRIHPCAMESFASFCRYFAWALRVKERPPRTFSISTGMEELVVMSKKVPLLLLSNVLVDLRLERSEPPPVSLFVASENSHRGRPK